MGEPPVEVDNAWKARNRLVGAHLDASTAFFCIGLFLTTLLGELQASAFGDLEKLTGFLSADPSLANKPDDGVRHARTSSAALAWLCSTLSSNFLRRDSTPFSGQL